MTLALLALASATAAAGCGSGSPSIGDPNEVIARSATSALAVQSLHVKLEVSGKVSTSALSGGSATGVGATINLTGTTVEGDVDVSRQAADLKFAVPSLFGTTGEVIVLDGNLYYKISLVSDKFTESKLSALVPGSIASAGAIASVAPSAAVSALDQALGDIGGTATLLAGDQVNGQDAYHMSIALSVAKLNFLLASQGVSATSAMKLDSATAEYWVYKDSLLPAQIAIAGSAGSTGNLDLTLTLTDFGKSMSIAAPDASQIGS